MRKIDKELRAARAGLAEIERAIGQKLQDNKGSRASVRGFKIAQTALLQEAEQARQKIVQLEAQGPAAKAVPTSDLVSLKKDRKVIAEAIKMAAYQMDSDLVGTLVEDYARCADEGRTLLHAAAFQSAGVGDGELRVTLVPQPSPHRTRAIAKLCQMLTEMGVNFPETGLRLSLAVAEPVNIR